MTNEGPTAFTPPPRPRDVGAAEYAYSTLREAIQGGEFIAGAALREQDMADWLGVSRTPVREALQRLLSDGLLRRDPVKGMTVTAETIEQTIEAFTVMEALEPVAARLAATRGSEADRVRLQALNTELRRSMQLGDDKTSIQLASRLHSAIWSMSGNETLRRILEGIDVAGGGRRRRAGLAVDGRAEAVEAEHDAIVECIVKGDADGAERLVLEHLQSAREARISLSLKEELGT